MASAEPRWQTRLRAYRAENNAQFGVSGPSPQEILASNTRAATPGRIRGLSQRQMYDSNLAARGGDPSGLQKSIERRRAQQQSAEEARAIEEAKATLRAQREQATTSTTATASATTPDDGSTYQYKEGDIDPVTGQTFQRAAKFNASSGNGKAARNETATFERGPSSRAVSRRVLNPSTVTGDDGQKVSWTKWRMNRAAKHDGF